jgi:hypothetical protein
MAKKISAFSNRINGAISATLLRLSEAFYIKMAKYRHLRALKRIRKKQQWTSAFLVIFESAWKYEGIYRLMEKDQRFQPVLIICPYIMYGEVEMLTQMQNAFDYFNQRGYYVVKSYEEQSGIWLDVKTEINPDLLFFTNPYDITLRQYSILNFKHHLTLYVPYGINAANIQQSQYNLLFHNLIWKCYYESKVHSEMAVKYARNKGSNVVVSGFPACDVYLDETYSPANPWKVTKGDVKRIVWAPHHTIEENNKVLAYSNFLTIHDFMISLLIKFDGKIQIAFKPHPILKQKLYDHPEWGRERTEQYYNDWNNYPNGQLEEHGYEDLFLTSDALIFDSISFLSEYLYTRKPSLFIVRDDSIPEKFNEFGKIAFKLVYKSYNQAETIRFIDEVVIKNDDSLFMDRNDFLNTYLVFNNKMSSSEFIFHDIIKEISR